MAKPQRWTDEWVRSLEHPSPGKPEAVYRDPSLSGHRLVISRHRKVFEVQGQPPKQYWPNGRRRTYKVQTGDAIDTRVEQSRERAAVVLGRIRRGEDPRARPPEQNVTVAGAWEEFKKRPDIRGSTIAVYDQAFESTLKPWGGDKTLRHLVDHPVEARDEHQRVTKERGRSAADHA